MSSIVQGDSSQAVAYALFEKVLETESHAQKPQGGMWYPSKDWILDTYAECLVVVMEPGKHWKATSPKATTARP